MRGFLRRELPASGNVVGMCSQRVSANRVENHISLNLWRQKHMVFNVVGMCSQRVSANRVENHMLLPPKVQTVIEVLLLALVAAFVTAITLRLDGGAR